MPSDVDDLVRKADPEDTGKPEAEHRLEHRIAGADVFAGYTQRGQQGQDSARVPIGMLDENTPDPFLWPAGAGATRQASPRIRFTRIVFRGLAERPPEPPRRDPVVVVCNHCLT